MRQGKGITTSVTVPSDMHGWNTRGRNTTDGGAPCAQEANGAKAQNLALDTATVALMIRRENVAMFPHGNGAVSGDRAQLLTLALQMCRKISSPSG